MVTLLSQIKQGQKARVVSVEGGAQGRRLVEMGLYPGKQICFLRKSPFTDPLQFQIGGASISIRKSEAELVTVESF